MEIHGAPIGSNQTEPVVARNRLSLYLVLLFFAALSLYAAPFIALRVSGFERWGGSVFGPALDYGFRSKGQDADIVIFGDSSALFGVDPIQMYSVLGLKVINLPNTNGSLHVTGDMPLQRYLRDNKVPKLIIFYFAPWDLNYSHTENSALYEGEEMLVRNGSFLEILDYARSHRVDFLLFPFQFYLTAPRASILSFVRHQDRGSAIAKARGHMDAVTTRSNLRTPCSLPPSFLQKTTEESVQALISRYKFPETKVLFFLAPIPLCVNARSVVERSYDDLPAAAPKQMEPGDFLGDNEFIHLTPNAVPPATTSLIDGVQRALNNRLSERNEFSNRKGSD